MSTDPILEPLPGERVLSVSPSDPSGVATTWLRRPNLFPGRTLTAATLEARSDWAAGRLAQRGQAFVAGVIDGLDVGFSVQPDAGDGVVVRLSVGPGMGLAASGEDVVLVRSMDTTLGALPVVAPPGVFQGGAFGGGGILQPREIGPTFGEVRDTLPGALPTAGILVLQPTTVEVRSFDPHDPCERGCGEAVDFEDVRLADAARLLWYAWPEDWRPLPPSGPRRRNRLAYSIFQAEGQLGDDELLPWEAFGVPVGVAVLDGDGAPVFLDRYSVVRRGGRGRASRLHVSGAGLVGTTRLPTLWQARIEQLAEEIAGLDVDARAPEALARCFDTLPPCGLLPRDVVDFTRGRSAFFPEATELDAVPVPLDQLDLAFRESAGLAPIELARSERVRVLVPVDAASWDPRLLLRETLDPEFQQTLDRFLMDRSRALAGRQATRIKSSVLLNALSGTAPAVPAIGDDPAAVEEEALGAWGPPPGAFSGHRTGIHTGVYGYGFDARNSLTPGEGDDLFTWVFLDPEHTPRTLMLEWRGPNGAVRRGYWGENLIDRGTDGRNTRLRVGDLPPAGRWVRLRVSAAALDYEGSELSGMGFAIYGGGAAFSVTGAISEGRERVWFQQPPPGEPPWDVPPAFELLSRNDLLAPLDPRYGVRPDDEKGEPISKTLEDLRVDPRITSFLSGAEQNALPGLGIEGFIAFLADRADRADDLVDYGFLKVQTDIYRVRQLVLDSSDATRLAVSPTLAGIAKGETATATQERISSFFNNLKSPEEDPEADLNEPEPEGEDDGGPNLLFNSSVLFNNSNNSANDNILRFAARSLGGGSTLRVLSEVGAPTVSDVVKAGTLTQPLFKAPLYTPKDITNSQPLVGRFDLRTLSLAERLKEPRATEARDYATSTRHEAVVGLIRLADELMERDGEVPGLFEGIDVWGLENEPFTTGGNTIKERMTRPFVAFLDKGVRSELLGQLLSPPQRQDSDEGALFSDTADLADRTVALLRQIEGRIRRYREAIAACRGAAAELRRDLAAAGKGESGWSQVLGEARHDVAVARALIAEEEARLEGINARRKDILEREVTFLAYVRPRTADDLGSAPSRTLDPGLLAAPAPACLKEGAAVPEELDAILAVVREAPSDWFRLQRRLLDGLVKVGSLVDAVRTAQMRTSVLQRKTAVPSVATTTGTSRLTTAMATLQLRQTTRLAPIRAQGMALDVSRLKSLSWRTVRAQAAEVVSLGDLIEGAHRNGQVARDAAAFFERFGRICGCLHEAFSEVTPSIRLDWAEILSEFDGDVSLRNLSNLSRFTEIDFDDQRRLQGLVDWLFDQVDPKESRARDLVDDVVRVCLLLASHAPVGRILAGHLPRPVTVRPGLRVPLIALDPNRLRLGMQALLMRQNQVVARAEVEDFARDEVSARVTFAAEANLELGTDVRVQFIEAAELGLR